MDKIEKKNAIKQLYKIERMRERGCNKEIKTK